MLVVSEDGVNAHVVISSGWEVAMLSTEEVAQFEGTTGNQVIARAHDKR